MTEEETIPAALAVIGSFQVNIPFSDGTLKSQLMTPTEQAFLMRKLSGKNTEDARFCSAYLPHPLFY